MENKIDCFDHVVVLMLENRSFDNILGYLSTDVDGVIGKNLSNPVPTRYKGKPVRGAGDGPVYVSQGRDIENPNPDPGEYFPHVNTQLYNCVAPKVKVRCQKKFDPPYNQPVDVPGDKQYVPVTCDQLPYPAPMTGFVQDYYNKALSTKWFGTPSRDQYKVIMQCFPPELVPVSAGLAKNFAVFDKWHCAVPSQTFCNRSFFNAATSNGQVVNSPYLKWLSKDFNAPTIFNRLEDLNKSWVIYYDKADFFPLTLLIHFQRLWPLFKDKESRQRHFKHMEHFDADVANGDLPAYAFVEPRLFFNHNDQHPPIKILGFTQKSTVTAGEELINKVYNAVRNSDCRETGKSNSINTLLTITYDEHGGCYDHVSPPQCATPPGDGAVPEMSFPFDRLGIRVPTMMISAWIDPQVISSQKQHTSMLKTLSTKWRFDNLTKRDASAPEFLEVFNRTSPRPGSEWPSFTPIEHPKGSENTDNLKHPLNDLQLAIVNTINHIENEKAVPFKSKMKVGEALEFMKHRLKDLIGD